ncbi:hypothetical protein LSAT2_011188 [Lamellibrachia satsuma]|nr:hypothetical protein LSAT2_011188 [Lamellibrachia satsuma]
MPAQGRAAGRRALAAVLGCRKEEQRFDDTTAQLLGGDSGDESPPPSVTEDRHNEESIHAKTDLPTPSVRSATSANAVAGLSEKYGLSSVDAMLQPLSKKETKPINRVRKLHSTRVKRYSTKEQQKREKTSAAEVHIHPIAAESIYVCEDNIQGTCLFANRCACHHYPQPFVWQINAFDKWVTLDEVNDVIESSFCDPGKDEVLIKVPCDVFDGVFEMETFGNIQFAGMTMYISLQNMDLNVRRLTTKSYLCTEVDSCYLAAASDDDTHRSCKTRWIWYWESSNGTWNKYENQEPLEENYLSGRSECQFKVDGVMLIVNQTDLVQVNSRTGRRSNLRRRPVFFGTDPKKE